MLIVVGDNPDPIGRQAAPAKLAGIVHHGGHHQLSAALYRAAIVRVRFLRPTIDLDVRHAADGKTEQDYPPVQVLPGPRDLPDHQIRPRPTTATPRTIHAST
ncbi:hypothetical protein ACWEJ6_52075 [Nonomuraea sp. NPDC004702]